MKRRRKKKCHGCGKGFVPSPQNASKQRYCRAVDCKKASVREANKCWEAKNPDYHKGLETVERVKVMQKHLLDPKNLRRVPTQFSWVDHRLIRQRRLSGVSPSGWALYLFLITVGDEQGVSYYSVASISPTSVPKRGERRVCDWLKRSPNF